MANHVDNSVEQSNIDIKNAYILVFKAIKQINKPLTKAEIQLKTGLSLFNVEDALNLLMLDYYCELMVSDKGQIIYKFSLNKKRRASSFVENLSRVFDFIIKLFLFVFKLITTLVFFSYILTVGLALALVFVALAKSLQPLLMIFMAVFYGITMLFTDTKSFFSNELPADKKKTENLIIMVFGYAFGNRKAIDKLEQDKKILAYIKHQDNKITASDLMLITGWTKQKCNRELTYMLTHYRGEVSVTDNGVILYSFPEFDKEAVTEAKNTHEFYIWNNPLLELPYNYNDKTANKVIGGIAWFSLVLSFIVAFVYGFEYNISLLSLPNWIDILSLNIHKSSIYINADAGLWLSGFAYLILFFIFFVVSSKVAKSKNKKLNSKRFEQNVYYNRLFAIFDNLPHLRPEIIDDLGEKEQSYFVYDTGGDFKVNEESGELYIDYSFLQEELETVSTLREESEKYEFDKERNKSFLLISVVNEVSLEDKRKTKIKRKRRVVTLGFAALFILFVYFSGDIMPVIKTNAVNGMFESVTVNHQSKIFQYVDQSSYGSFRELTILNPSSENPIKWPEHLQFTRQISIINSTDSIYIPKAPYLEDLTLDNCGLDSIPKNVFMHGNIQELNLNNNHIKSLPWELEFMSDLSFLSVENNELDSLQEFLLHFNRLYRLSLAHNKIDKLPDAFANGDISSELDLSYNRISVLPENFWAVKISQIDLSNNLLSELPELKMDSSVIFYLFLQSNKIEELPKDLFLMEYLSELNVSDNLLEHLPDSMSNFKKLRKLLLANNRISELTSDLASCSYLSLLSIENNPIVKVSPDLVNLSNKYPPCKIVIDKNMDNSIKQDVFDYFGSDMVVIRN